MLKCYIASQYWNVSGFVVLNTKMKCFVVTALIVLVVVFCISHVDGSNLSNVKSVEKRQVPLPPVRNIEESCSITELQRRNGTLECSNPSVGQQLLDVYAECGHNDLALREEQKCGRNETGGFCYELSSNSTLTQLARSIVFNCLSSCDFFCNNSLQQLRDSTGCCANYLLTNDYLLGGRRPNLNLWSLCGLRPPNNCSSTLRFTQRPNEMFCSQQELTYRINRLSCNPNYITPFIDILRNCSREEDAQSRINNCGVNRYGRFCFEAQANASQFVSEVQSECFTNDETCTIACKIALNMYQTRADCCLNNLYNNPRSSNYRTTNPMLWSLCGVSRPGFCRNTIDSSSAYSVLLQVSVAVTGLSAVIAMLI